MTAQIQVRRDTAAAWTSANPQLKSGEFGYEIDTGSFKIGDGSTPWTTLAYTYKSFVSFTPTLAQGVSTDIAKTVTYAKYCRTGKLVTGNIKVASTAAGTSGSAVTLTLPVTASTSGLIVGTGSYFDTGTAEYRGAVYLQSTTTLSLIPVDAASANPSTNNLALGVGTIPAAFAVASGDIFNVSFNYEAA